MIGKIKQVGRLKMVPLVRGRGLSCRMIQALYLATFAQSCIAGNEGVIECRGLVVRNDAGAAVAHLVPTIDGGVVFECFDSEGEPIIVMGYHPDRHADGALVPYLRLYSPGAKYQAGLWASNSCAAVVAEEMGKEMVELRAEAGEAQMQVGPSVLPEAPVTTILHSITFGRENGEYGD